VNTLRGTAYITFQLWHESLEVFLASDYYLKKCINNLINASLNSLCRWTLATVRH
jgi:hypothetical protein